MTLQECYRILGVTQATSLEDVKRAYRRRAFELHPDLNPQLGDSGQQFQLLNESYVILTRLIAVREARDERLKAEKRQEEAVRAEKTSYHANKGWSQSDPDLQTGDRQESRPESEKSNFAPGAEASTGTGSEQVRQGANDTGAHQSADGQERSSAQNAQRTTPGHNAQRSEGVGENVYTEQQEVLRDILNDPFARRVFEDIYSAIRKKIEPSAAKPVQEPAREPQIKKKIAGKGFSFDWGQRKFNLDFSKGVGGVVKDWMRSQIDEEQIFQVPARKLFPGARIRLQIRHGFSEAVTTLDVVLPADFTEGKPIRLKGMGKKLGRWQGDLYLRLEAKR